ncbi:MAG: AAA family ATPase [Candidatus Bipolaricaulota bacterium]|nr:AAA family ATPase [Candidatus Bipolaricaulota bacterium]
MTRQDLVEAQAGFALLRERIGQVIVGQEAVVEVALWAVLGKGHVLLEGVPGLGKTLLVRALARALGLSFSRIQFTPDLMPADIVGTNILSGEGFRFLPGPLFAHVVLADEVNRATPKTQSALLEAMQEGQATVGGATHRLPQPFTVLATQNPIEMEGTYPLPEAQVDRFLFKAEVPFPAEADLVEIVRRNTERDGIVLPEPVLTVDGVLRAQAVVAAYPVPEPLLGYAARLVLATHPDHPLAPEAVRKYVQYGASPRGSLALILGAKARAFLAGRYHVAVDDVGAALRPALVHRIIPNFRADADGVTAADLVEEVRKAVRAP